MLKGQNEIRMIWLMALIIAGIGMWYAEIRQFSYLCALAFAISVMHYVDDLQKPAEQLAAEAGLPLEPTSKLPLYISSVMALAGSPGQIGFLTALGITAWIFFFLRWLKRLERNLFSIQQQIQRRPLGSGSAKCRPPRRLWRRRQQRLPGYRPKPA